jgi:hypothetical protein
MEIKRFNAHIFQPFDITPTLIREFLSNQLLPLIVSENLLPRFTFYPFSFAGAFLSILFGKGKHYVANAQYLPIKSYPSLAEGY